MAVTELNMEYIRLCMADFEANKTARNWDRMIDALVTRGNVSRKKAVARCEAKYGKMFGGAL